MADWPEGKAYRIGKDRYGTYRRSRDVEVPWGAVAILALVAVLLIWSFIVWTERVSDCTSRGGTYLGNGRGYPTCIKDGKIIVIYKPFGEKVVNP
jgi:hypothetical protein